MSESIVLAVDGGNSKTDLALVRSDGEVLALVRGPLSSPHRLGLDGALEVLRDLYEQAAELAGVGSTDGPVAEIGQLLMAGIDFPSEEDELREAVEARRWAKQTRVRNDTFAVLRAGTTRGWGVAVVCGSGINCVGVAPDGRQARFPALGPITGDWGGGYDIGLAALSAAARSEDGRGSKTTLERAVPGHFGFGQPTELAEAIHRGRVQQGRLDELAPVVFAEAATDEVAAQIVARLPGEIVAMVRVALERLALTQQPVDVVLGGGVIQSGDGRLLTAIESGLAELGPAIQVRVTTAPPIVGAALLGLDELDAKAEDEERVRRSVAARVGTAESA